jgi:hypothetical protein
VLVTARPSDLPQIKSNLLNDAADLPVLGLSPALVPQLNQALTPAECDGLTRTAAAMTKARLTAFDNELSSAHAEAIEREADLMTKLATRQLSGRHAVPLDCGLGKTQTLVHWSAAVIKADLPLSVLVCTSKLEELAAIHAAMREAGIPEADLGIMHSSPSNPAYPKPTTGNASRRIMLATHQKVKGGNLTLDITHYQDHPRDLIVWDESLIVSSANSVELVDLFPDIAWLKDRAKTLPDTSDDLMRAVRYLSRCRRLMEEEAKRLKRGRKPRELRMPLADADELAAYRKALPDDENAVSIRTFLDMAMEPLRIIDVNRGAGILKYALAVPSWLDRVVILDASAPIRELVKADATITIDPWFTGTVLKRYDAVTIKWWKRKGGRVEMTKAFSGRRDDREVSREIARLIADIPSDEGVLLVTFKLRGSLDMAKVLKADLKALGIDVDAKLPDGSDRFSWTTFGRTTASNAWVRHRHIVFVGALYRRDVDLAASLIGQRDDLTAEVTRSDVLAVKHSEIAHELYQGINRTACRRTIAGQADRTTAYVIIWDRKPLDIVIERMPGARIEEWEVEDEATLTLTRETAKAITTYLTGLPPSVTKVSVRRLKTDLGLTDLNNRPFQAARDAAAKASGWAVEKQSLVRA